MDGNATLHASKRLAVFVFLVTICFGLADSRLTLAAGVWTNEPAGAAVVLDCPFNSVSSCGILDVYSSGRITSDSSAPVSPSAVIQSTLRAGQNTGGMQLNYVTPQVSNEMYMGLMWRTNPEFYGRPANNKTFFIRGPQVNGVWYMVGPPGGPFRMVFSHNTGTLDNSHTCGAHLGLGCEPNVGSGAVTQGVWTKLEAYVKKSTTATSRDGIVRWWVNGVLAGNYTNMNYAQNGLNEWVWSETWDGTVNPVPAQDWSHFLDHLHISIPNGGPSTDNPPGPPASPTLRGVTTP